jgi:pimeloyl-ACP methyl ester carboxylesterase
MTLNYKTLGSGKPLVILHGLLGSLDNWVTVSKYLSKSYKVYIIDLPNHGKSYHSQVFSYEDMSNDLDSFFNKNRLTNFSLLGHSMGGKLALKYTDMFEDKIDKLIIVDIANTGAAIILISQDLDEILEISNKVAFLTNGNLSIPTNTTDIKTDEIGAIMGGISD